MHKATLETLPTEVLDLIFGFVDGSEVNPLLSLDARALRRRKTYLALGQTSQALFAPARNRLYADPLSGGGRNWTRAIKLLNTLRENGCALGRLVNSLITLPDWIEALSTSEPEARTSSFQLVGKSKSFSWMVAVITACPKLHKVGVAFKLVRQTTKLITALKNSLGTLTTIRVQSTQHLPVYADVTNRLLSAIRLEELSALELVGLSSGGGRGEFDNPHTPMRVRNIKLSSQEHFISLPLDRHIQFLPINLAPLTSLVYELPLVGISDVPELLQIIGKHLQRLVICPKYRLWDGTCQNYALSFRNFYGTWTALPATFPSELFYLFPSIEHLELHNMRVLSVGRLDSLSRTSPAIVTLLFPGCLWLSDGPEPHRTVHGWELRLFRDARIAEVFRTFSKLKKVDLGVVPFEEESGLGAVTTLLAEEDVELEYELCTVPDRCPNCRGYH
ncbi:hypothetical protein JCM11251_006453 [Rhodosporidiobolus azoricus]